MRTFTALIALAALTLLVGCEQSSTEGMTPSRAPARPGSVVRDKTPVTVYYLHRTFRCDSCNAMERMTRDALHETHAEDLAAGRLAFKSVDFQANEELAARYEVDTPTVVVARHGADNGAAGYRKLDELWSLKADPAAFRSALVTAVDRALEGSE